MYTRRYGAAGKCARRGEAWSLKQDGFRIELHRKDLNLALDGARKLNLLLPNTATCQELSIRRLRPAGPVGPFRTGATTGKTSES